MRPSPEASSRRHALPALLVLAGVLALGVYAYAPFFADLREMGFQDWDVQAAYRAVTPVSLLRYHELPFLNPWLCGGFPAWGYAEGATNLVSPFAPLYFVLSVPVALRVECLLLYGVGALSSFLLAGRFTRIVALRALVAVLWMLDSRATLQVSSGHVWHLVYAWMPLVLYLFDRAIERRGPRRGARGGRLHRDAALAALVLALMVYTGGIYPVPHTALVLCLFAAVRALSDRSLRPLWALAVVGGLSLGLAAPKLLPIVDTLHEVPRLADSREHLTLGQVLVMVTDRHQSFGDHPLLDLPANWAWWEWGIYLGWAGLACVLLSPLGLRREAGAQSRAAFCAGLFCATLAFGSFARFAPWPLLHQAPFFSSQHVVSRFFYPAVLLLALAFAGGASGLVARIERRWPPLRVALPAAVLLLGWDLARVARLGTVAPFHLTPPPIAVSPTFQQTDLPPYYYGKPQVAEQRLRFRYDWPGISTYLGILTNRGVVRCYGVPEGFRPGATGVGSRLYRAPAFLQHGPGQATIERWTPNSADVAVRGAAPGSLAVYDMNYDASWTVDGHPAENAQGMVAARVRAPNQTLHFRYRPRRFYQGLALGLVTLLAAAALLGGSAFRRRGFR